MWENVNICDFKELMTLIVVKQLWVKGHCFVLYQLWTSWFF